MTAPAAWVPPGKQTFVDPVTGEALAFGYVFHYVPGTDVKKDTWQDYDRDALNMNPIVLDENGQCIIWGDGNYRQVLMDAAQNVIWNVNTTVGNQADNVLSQGAIMGLQIANNAGNPTTQIDVAVGQARDSTNVSDINLEAPMTKDITAVWAAGTGNGGRDAATALAASDSFHVFVIYNPDDLLVDVLFSKSATNPNLPNGYTLFRRLGGLPRLGGSNRPPSGTGIPTFLQFGNQFMLASPNNEYTNQTGSAAVTLTDWLVPLGVKVTAIIYAQFNIPAGGALFRITDPDLGIPPAFGGTNQFGQIRITAEAPYLTAMVYETTSTSGQLYVQQSDAAGIWAGRTRGWIDLRGQNG